MNSIGNQKQVTKSRPFYSVYALCVVAFLAWASFSHASTAQDNGIDSLRKTSQAFAAVAKKTSPGVVFIQVEKVVQGQPAGEFSSPFGEQQSPFGDDFFKRFFGPSYPQEYPRSSPQGPSQQQRVPGQGSGFIISEEGYILTNNHVVGGADKIMVKLQDGREFTAETIGTDPHSDIAVIKIDADKLPALAFGDSDALEVGEWVLAIGNPFGLSHTLTAGIVSAKGRSSVGLADYENFIQTDAAINPGNSGGPLVDLDGKAVGMNTAIFSGSGGYMRIGFAIPINMASSIAEQLIESGSVTRGYLGIVIQELTPELAKSFGLPDHNGILVAEVSPGSPAQKAGIEQGDVIVEFDGSPVTDVGVFRNRVSLKAPDSGQKMTILRDGKRRLLKVTIGRLPDQNEVAVETSNHTLGELGITVQTLTPELARKFDYPGENGVVITQVTSNSIAEEAGLQPGTLIQEVNRNKVRNVDDFKQALEQSKETGSVLLLARVGEYSRYLVLSFS